MAKKTKEQISKNMSQVRSKGSKIETKLAKALWKAGVRYRKNRRDIFGNPDISIKKLKLAIFADSEFWHGKNWEQAKYEHKSNQDFWFHKIERNIQRDNEVNERLKNDGWTVLRFWGKDIDKELQNCVSTVLNTIELLTNKNY